MLLILFLIQLRLRCLQAWSNCTDSLPQPGRTFANQIQTYPPSTQIPRLSDSSRVKGLSPLCPLGSKSPGLSPQPPCPSGLLAGSPPYSGPGLLQPGLAPTSFQPGLKRHLLSEALPKLLTEKSRRPSRPSP